MAADADDAGQSGAGRYRRVAVDSHDAGPSGAAR